MTTTIAFQSKTSNTPPRISLIINGERNDLPDNEIPTMADILMLFKIGLDKEPITEVFEAIGPVLNLSMGSFSLETEDAASIAIGIALMAMDFNDRSKTLKAIADHAKLEF